MTEVNNTPPADELVEVKSIGQFAAMVAGWHANIVAQLYQAAAVPDDVEILFTPAEGAPERVMTKDELVGFKAALVVAISLFEELPFDAFPNDPVPETQAGDEEGTGQ